MCITFFSVKNWDHSASKLFYLFFLHRLYIRHSLACYSSIAINNTTSIPLKSNKILRNPQNFIYLQNYTISSLNSRAISYKALWTLQENGEAILLKVLRLLSIFPSIFESQFDFSCHKSNPCQSFWIRWVCKAICLHPIFFQIHPYPEFGKRCASNRFQKRRKQQLFYFYKHTVGQKSQNTVTT